MALTQITEKGIKDGEIVNADVNASAAIAKSKLAGLDIVNADINASAAIAGSKLAASTTSVAGSMSAADKTKLDGVATSANNYTHPNHSGDVTSSGDGATTIADNAVTLAKMAGGTDGQIITYDANGDPIAVGPGTDGQVLTSTGAGSPPAFEDAAGGPSLANDANNRVITGTGSGLNGEANLTFDGSTLDITGAVTSSGTITANGYLSVSDQIMHTGDVDTTVRFPAADTVAIETGGSERLRVDSGGRLLIGTTTNSGTSSSGDDIIIGSIGDSTSRGITFATTADATIRWADAGDNSMGRIQYLNNTDIMSFHTANAERLRIDSDGLKFNGDTAAANALDDYEEGDWNPVLYGTTSAGTTTYTTQSGSYTKIGNLVTANIYLNWSNQTGSGDMVIGSFPFTRKSGSNYGTVGTVVFSNWNYNSGEQTVGYMGDGNILYLRQCYDNEAWQGVQHDSAGELMASVTYRTT